METMEPEKDFLKNAAIMVDFAQKEIKQFLTWTAKGEDYRTNAEEVSSDLGKLLAKIEKLQKQYGAKY